MLEHHLDENDGILTVEPSARLAAEDFAALAAVVDGYLEKNEALAGLLIDAEAFPGWEDFAALLSHLKFVREHHRRIKKVAALSDSAMLKFMPRIAAHFVSAEVRHFATAERSAALDWLRAVPAAPRP
jgi:hypothetical protein